MTTWSIFHINAGRPYEDEWVVIAVDRASRAVFYAVESDAYPVAGRVALRGSEGSLSGRRERYVRRCLLTAFRSQTLSAHLDAVMPAWQRVLDSVRPQRRELRHEDIEALVIRAANAAAAAIAVRARRSAA